jgi:predicted RNA-binding Zn-ribbon protein involved in translation (DUF1610 family)
LNFNQIDYSLGLYSILVLKILLAFIKFVFYLTKNYNTGIALEGNQKYCTNNGPRDITHCLLDRLNLAIDRNQIAKFLNCPEKGNQSPARCAEARTVGRFSYPPFLRKRRDV